jgi:Na+/melibiose symporter-like transporter
VVTETDPADPGWRDGAPQPVGKSARGLGAAFTNLFTASIASNLGDGIARTAMPLLAARLTDDALLIGGVAAMAMLPWLFCAIPAGILVDRADRRTAMAVSNTVRGILGGLLILLIVGDQLTILWLYVIIFVYGACETVYDGAARAVVPSIVGRVDLPRANSRIEASELVVQNFLAGPFTSVLFAVTALIPLGVNAAAFAVAAGLALVLPRAASGRQHAAASQSVTGRAEAAWYRQFVDGYRFITRSRMLVTLWLVSTVGGLAFAISFASFVLFVLDPLGVPEAWFGVFMLSGAVGGVIGTVIAAPLKKRLGTGMTMAIAMLFGDASLILVGIWPNVWVTGVVLALSSAMIIVWNVLVMSLRQSIIPGHLLGRVHGTWRTLLWGATPVGSVIGGFIGRIDLALPFLVGGILSLVVTAVYFRFITRLPNPEDVPDPLGPNPLVPLS